MDLFTKETKVEDLEKYINWDSHILDFVTPIDKAGERVNTKIFPTSISLVEQFENEFHNSLPSKQKELLYGGLRFYRNKINTLRKSVNTPDPDDEDYFLEAYAQDLFKHRIYLSYTNGDNPKLSFFKDEIRTLLMYDLANDKWMTESGLNDLEFNKTPLTDIVKNTFKFIILKEIEFVITTVDFFKYLENKVRDFGEPETIIQKDIKKLLWKGTPAQFSFIIDLLINKGYLEKPTPYAERNAGLFLEIFEFSEHNPSKESLGKLLHKDHDAISNAEHRSKFFKIPNRKDLDK